MDKLVFARHGSVLRLPPGFRFLPTDEELVVQYLKRKIHSCPLPASIIPEIIDLKNYDPWDLPGGRKEVKYFFTRRDARILAHGQSNRAARSGCWKAEGKEKQVVASWHSQVVGMKKVLVFYRAKPQARTDWIMHEYRHNSTVSKGDWVLCRIFRRKRTISKMESDNEQGGRRPSSFSSSCVTELSDNGGSDGEEEAISERT